MLTCLEAWCEDHHGIDLSTLAHDGVDNQDDIDHGQAEHGDSEEGELEICTQEVGAVLPSVNQVNHRVACVAFGVPVGLLLGREPVLGTGEDGASDREQYGTRHEEKVLVGNQAKANLLVDQDWHRCHAK